MRPEMIASSHTADPAAAPARARPAIIGGTVLVASDGSPAADAALRLARRLELTGRAGAVRVVTALEPLAAGGPGPELAVLDAKMDEERRAYLHELIGEQVQRVVPGNAWPVDTVWGNPARIVGAAAVEHGASLVLMGFTHHSRLHRMLGGETSLSVIRHCAAPVLLVSHDTADLPRTAVAGVDFSRGSILAARAALDLLAADGGTLHLVHVRPAVEMPPERWEAWDVAYAAGVPALMRDVRHLLGEHPHVHIESAQLRGHPRRDLLEYADRVGAGLLAVASHGHGMVERMLVGSTTAGLVRDAHCSLLVVPAFPGGRALGVSYAGSEATGSVK